MAAKTKRATAEEQIRAAVRMVFGAGSVASFSYSLPAVQGAQISMAGEPSAWGNRAAWDAGAVGTALRSLPALRRAGEEDLRRYAERMRFVVQPGECDRFVAAAAVISALTEAGFGKLLITADTPSERDALASFLALTRSGIGNVSATVYLPGEFGEGPVYSLFASVYGYLTSPGREILLLDGASFCRRTNLLRRPVLAEESGVRSFADLIAQGRPAVIVSARTADSARNLARAAEVFDPAAAVLLCAENKRLRDAVIYRPERKSPRKKPDGSRDSGLPEQLSF